MVNLGVGWVVATMASRVLSLHHDAWVVRGRHDLRLHVQEVDQFVEVKLVRICVFHLLPPAKDHPFEGEPLRTVHVERLAEALEAVLGDGQVYLAVFDGFVDQVFHILKLSLLTFHFLTCLAYTKHATSS